MRKTKATTNTKTKPGPTVNPCRRFGKSNSHKCSRGHGAIANEKILNRFAHRQNFKQSCNDDSGEKSESEKTDFRNGFPRKVTQIPGLHKILGRDTSKIQDADTTQIVDLVSPTESPEKSSTDLEVLSVRNLQSVEVGKDDSEEHQEKQNKENPMEQKGEIIS